MRERKSNDERVTKNDGFLLFKYIFCGWVVPYVLVGFVDEGVDEWVDEGVDEGVGGRVVVDVVELV